MKHKTSQRLYAYWNEVRGTRLAPTRLEIEPMQIASCLPETFVLECKDAQTYPFRLAGTRMCQQFQTEFQGRNFLEGWSSIDRVILERALSSAARGGGVVHAEVVVYPRERTRQATIELVIMPMVHLNNTSSRFLGGWSALDAPNWLGGEPIASRTLTVCDIIQPHAPTEDLLATDERQSPIQAHTRTGRLVRVDGRNFRVYDGGLKHENNNEN